MSNAHELKGLQVRKSKLEVEIKALDGDRTRLSQDIGRKKTELNGVQQKIDSYTIVEPVVTEHALLRYIERVMGVNLAEVQSQILSPHNKAAIAFAGSCRIKANGVELVVKDRRVISVI